MKRLLLFGLLTFGSVSTYAQAGFSSPMNATECSNAFFKALLDEDSNALNNILADDFSIVSFDGRQIDRNMLSQAVAQGYLSVETGMLSGARTREYGDVGVVTGTWNVKGKIESNGFQNEVTYTIVSVKKGGSWKVATVQLTAVQ
ncbi:nuclear transport factor 2 family protein [Dyadobacter subterraneus]|uniref:Nuclear transport factor 2 family protein n=1 Tax=Dyadobacter subterraneus TaxID=2773304 RepID=A0ABR9WKC9_9BACT|nr:nuclear transport factor 2 family protein [Dyadobacter subterraneus]MBE9465935.1 nuclear transport factor 2 family protein [Dyadobacter subterraneus]